MLPGKKWSSDEKPREGLNEADESEEPLDLDSIEELLKSMTASSDARFSDEAFDICQTVIDELRSADIDDPQKRLSFIDDVVNDELNRHLIYYSDCWDFLRKNQYTDFSEAIAEAGAKTLVQIAAYFMGLEVMSLLSKIGLA